MNRAARRGHVVVAPQGPRYVPPSPGRYRIETETPDGWVLVTSRATRPAAEAHMRSLEGITQREYRVRDGGAS